jgi:hypothetical protein
MRSPSFRCSGRVRDSKNLDGPALALSPEGFAGLVAFAHSADA